MAETTSLAVAWLHKNSKWLGSIRAIAAVIGLLPMLFSSSENGGNIRVEGNNNGGQIAGGDITNVGDPRDKKSIASLLTTTKAQQSTTKK